MEIDITALARRDRYKLLVGFVIPRPIALVSTTGPEGGHNAAPFSFFNVFGEEPASIVLGFNRRPDGSHKDTPSNIMETGEFVVNMVDEDLAAKMNDCAIDFPAGVDELAEVGLTPESSHIVKACRIAESPVCFECRHVQTIQFKPHRILTIGEVVWMRARDSVVDMEKVRVVDDAYKPVGRLYADQYARQTDRFELPRQSYDEWVDRTRRKRHGLGC